MVPLLKVQKVVQIFNNDHKNKKGTHIIQLKIFDILSRTRCCISFGNTIDLAFYVEFLFKLIGNHFGNS